MRTLTCFMFTLFSLLVLCSCTTKTEKEAVVEPVDNVVEVTARDFSFQVVDEIPSGWTTFKFINTGHAEHFFLLNLLPDSVSYDMYHEQVTKPFDVVFDSLKAGMSREDAIGLLVGMIPPWYFTSVKSMGGTGIVDAGKTAQTTLKLEPGTYAMECYIKEKGVFHTALGMIRPITVTEEVSPMEPPTPNVELTLTNFAIATDGAVTRGRNTVAVHFNEQPEVGLGNDIHLVRMNDTTAIEDVIYWLDWMNIEGLETPSPVEFLGGTQEMPVGYTSYFTVDLEPGDYAWIAETTASQGMVELFTIE